MSQHMNLCFSELSISVVSLFRGDRTFPRILYCSCYQRGFRVFTAELTPLTCNMGDESQNLRNMELSPMSQ